MKGLLALKTQARTLEILIFLITEELSPSCACGEIRVSLESVSQSLSAQRGVRILQGLVARSSCGLVAISLA